MSQETEIKCPCGCGKTIAKQRKDEIWVFCKKCKKEVRLEPPSRR